MRTYSEFRPSSHDTAGLGLADRQDWLVHPCVANRDADVLTESNFESAKRELDMADPDGSHHEVHRFGHWACGWFEIILVRPTANAALYRASQHVDALDNYPILDEDDYSDRQSQAADETWSHCYNAKERIAYIRDHRDQFEFSSFADMLGCVRGNYFAGSASELVQRARTT